MNFALASDEAEDFNVATNSIRENYKYSFWNKISIAILAILIPLIVFTSLYSAIALGRGQKEINAKRAELRKLESDTQDYSMFMGDIDIINKSYHFLNNDRTYSENQIKMLKLFSAIVPKEIKFTDINFVNATDLPDSVVTNEFFKEHLSVSGFVNQDRSVADIYLTDFLLELEKLKHFSEVLLLDKYNDENLPNNALFFRIRLDLKS
jgi:hypothetical protein